MPEEPVDFSSCDVCGRTILRGERVREYVTSAGEQVAVCALCLTRAEAAGWMPAELAGSRLEGSTARGRPGIALRARLGKVAERAREAAGSRRERGAGEEPARSEPAEAKPRPKAGQGRKAAQRKRPAARKKPASEKKGQPAKAQPGTPTPKRRTPRTPQRVMRGAIEQFNESPEAHKVAGLIRSLGEPSVGVRAQGEIAVVTIAWELSWYQWEIDAAAVREVAKGAEVDQLDDEARTWNAVADESGKLELRK